MKAGTRHGRVTDTRACHARVNVIFYLHFNRCDPRQNTRLLSKLHSRGTRLSLTLRVFGSRA